MPIIHIVQRRRHLGKAVSWRALASLETFFLGWVVTGSLAIGASISLIELFSKTLLYYLHERVWHQIKWGLNKSETDDIDQV